MARRIGPKCKRCRSVRQQLFLKGISCLGKDSQECVGNPPGQHGAKRRMASSQYGKQLIEKQKLKYIYGILEKQCLIYFKKASRMDGETGGNMLLLLERRLDNMIYRMGFAESRDHARQLVNHRFFLVNGQGVDIASYLLSEGDKISVRSKPSVRKRIRAILEKTEHIKTPEWIETDRVNLESSVLRLPEKDEFIEKIDEQSVVELYSR